MNPKDLKRLLERVKNGKTSVDTAMKTLKTLPFEDIGFATLDHHRSLRKGFPEVIWGEGKTASQISTIIKKMLRKNQPILVTRVDNRKAASIKKSIPKITSQVSVKQDNFISSTSTCSQTSSLFSGPLYGFL